MLGASGDVATDAAPVPNAPKNPKNHELEDELEGFREIIDSDSDTKQARD
jgi:hypothetical protein